MRLSMKLFVLVPVFFAAGFDGLKAQEVKSFNLEQCIEYAIENNPQLRKAKF